MKAHSNLFPLLCCSLLLLAFLSPIHRGKAQEQGVVVDTDVVYTFGQVMRFGLRIHSPLPIKDVTLFFNTPELEHTYVVEFEIEPAETVTVTHDVSLTQVRLAPFTTVNYWWGVTIDEEIDRVGEGQIFYEDDRFAWQTLSSNDAVVHWTGEELALGQAALDVVAQARPRLETVIPVGEMAPVAIYVYPSTGELRSALRLAGRDWVGAEAQPELGVLLVTAVNPRTARYDLGQSIPHEMTHLMLYKATGVGYENIPRWFEEGLATLFETTANPNYPNLIQEAIRTGDTIPFAELCAIFPAEESRARLAYAQSVSLLRFIQVEYGRQALTDMVHVFADGADCSSGVRRVLDVSLDELNADWLEAEKPLSAAAHFWQRNGVWFLLLGGGFGLMTLLLFPLVRREESEERV